LVIGRDKKDNENLEKLAGAGDITMQLADENGPTTLVKSLELKVEGKNECKEILAPEVLKISELKLGEPKNEKEILGIAMKLTGYYAAKLRGKKIKIDIINN